MLALELGLLQLRTHVGGVLEAGLDLLLAILDGCHDGLEGKAPQQERDDREIDNLRQQELRLDAEGIKDLRDGVGGLGMRGRRFDGVTRGLSDGKQNGEHGGEKGRAVRRSWRRGRRLTYLPRNRA